AFCGSLYACRARGPVHAVALRLRGLAGRDGVRRGGDRRRGGRSANSFRTISPRRRYGERHGRGARARRRARGNARLPSAGMATASGGGRGGYRTARSLGADRDQADGHRRLRWRTARLPLYWPNCASHRAVHGRRIRVSANDRGQRALIAAGTRRVSGELRAHHLTGATPVGRCHHRGGSRGAERWARSGARSSGAARWRRGVSGRSAMTHARQASPTVARVAIPQARALHTDPVGAPPPEVRVPALDAPRRTWLDPLVVGIVVLIVGVSILDGVPVGGYFDDGMYVVLAKALATGHGYHWLNLPGYPAATHFPPGYPFVLSLLWRVFPSFPGNVIVFKAANIVFLACSAAGVAIFARRRVGLPRWGAVAVALSASLGLPTLILGTQVMSEPFFLALLFPTLLFAERIADGDRRIGAIVALGVAVGLVTLVRTH